MRLKSLVAFVALAAASTVSADLLVWQVGEMKDKENLNQTLNIGYDYALLLSSSEKDRESSSVAIQPLYVDNSAVAVGAATPKNFEVGAVAAVMPTDYSSSYFFIELYDSMNNLVGYSDIVQGSALSQFMVTDAFNTNFGSMNAWGGGAWTATGVPEPTSGLLLLVGAAMLGLRRKKIA